MANSALRFTDPPESFAERLANLQGTWHTLNENHLQFRNEAGGVLNWFPSTGTVSFQGKPAGRERLENDVRVALQTQTASSPQVPERAVNDAAVGVSDLADTPDPVFGAFGPSGQSELVLGLIGAVGTDLRKVQDILSSRLRVCGYTVVVIQISTDVIPEICDLPGLDGVPESERLDRLMTAGTDARGNSNDNSILALGAAAVIASRRKAKAGSSPQPSPKTAYIISSLKHPEEVERLRQLYPQGFHLIAVHSDEKRRHRHLVEEKRIKPDDAQRLMERDQDEKLRHGQRVTDAFHMSDFFLRLGADGDELKQSLWRILDLLFGNPFVTPTFDEFAMFMAFSASLRSADLSRQVGAVIAVDDQVVATGANDCPKFGGGLYWPEVNTETKAIEDRADGRDHRRGEDSNKIEQRKIIEEIATHLAERGYDPKDVRDAVANSRIGDLTEFGRVVHAEMEALLSCGRARVSPVGGTLFSTTFPCHNCAKHIVAAGIHRVLFIEPYQKSKAAEFHSDSISVGFDESEHSVSADNVRFEPFVGVGPRRFFDLFSMRLGSGFRIHRKDSDGYALEWKPETSQLRLEMLPVSYLDLEIWASELFYAARTKIKGSPS